MPKEIFSFEKIREQVDIVDVVSQYLNLKRSGANFTALCPFHAEKTPSFVVSPQKQIFHCFGCGKGGDVIKFVSEINGLDYFDAAVKLAKDYNLDIDFKKYSSINNYFEITYVAAEAYHENLKKNLTNRNVQDFIKKRNINEEIIEKFFLGYAPDDSQFLIKVLKKRGIELKLANEIGLIKKEKNFYDTFRNRIIFPIRNLKGEIIAFGGRTLNKKIQPKYLNSPESAIYQKRKNLYGLFENKDIIKTKNETIVVEGYMDLISLYSNSIKNVVATLGTAFTTEQLNLINRFTENIIFLYDGDKAGIKAAIRGAIIAINKDFNPKIIYLKDNLDPDDFINKYGFDEFMELKNKSKDLVNFLKNIIFSSIDLKNLENRIRLMERFKKIYSDIDNPLYKDHFIKGCSEILSLNYREVKAHFNKTIRKAKYNKQERKNKINIRLEDEIIGWLLKNNDFLDNISSELFQNNTYKILINELKKGKDLNAILDSENFSESEKERLRFLALNNKFDSSNDKESVFSDLVKRLKKSFFERKLKDITEEIKKEEKNKNEERLVLLMKEQKAILEEMKKLDY